MVAPADALGEHLHRLLGGGHSTTAMDAARVSWVAEQGSRCWLSNWSDRLQTFAQSLIPWRCRERLTCTCTSSYHHLAGVALDLAGDVLLADVTEIAVSQHERCRRAQARTFLREAIEVGFSKRRHGPAKVCRAAAWAVKR